MSWEAPIMRSKTSFFNRTVFLSDCRRYWPLTAGYALLWLLLLPLTRLTELGHGRELLPAVMARDALNLAGNCGYWVAFFAGILFAMAAFSYLTNPRATNGLHALPARREELYVTHCLAGLCSQLAPQVLTVLLTAAVLASHGAFDARLTGLSLLALALPTVFFYCFGVFCMMFTGQILAAPVFYGILNILIVGVEFLIRSFAGTFLYGWAESGDPVLVAFSPIVKLAQNGVRATSNLYTRSADGTTYVTDAGRTYLLGLDWLLVYAAAGLVFAALGLLVYRARHSEATGNVVAIDWARPVFQYGVTFCTALALGQLLYFLFFGQYRQNGNYSLPGTLLCMAAAGLIGFFAAEMLLKKSVRVWKSGRRGAAVVTAVLLALGFAMSLDLTGYESYIPAADRIDSASVDLSTVYGEHNCHVTVRGAESLRLVTEAHRALVNDKRFQQSAAQDFWTDDADDPGRVGGYFNVRYTLKDGRTVRRSYTIVLERASLNDSASPAAALTALYNDPDIAFARSLGRYGFDADNDPRQLPDLRFTGGYFSLSHWRGDNYLGTTEHDLTPAEAQRIFDAVARDAAAGRIVDSLFEDTVSSYRSVELYATYLDTRDYNGSTRPWADDDGRTQITFDPVISERMTETAAALRELGLIESIDDLF